MCGICGVLTQSSSSAEAWRADLARMCEIIAHRGPDSQGVMADGYGGLGARRLSIIDLVTGDQPIANEDGTIWVAQNGEIYNYRDLRHEVIRLGHTLKTNSDTEILVHLYEEYGDRFIERCNGMFAIAIYDIARRRLYVARDRVGKKPLFYYATADSFWFASELKALFVNPSIPRRVYRPALFDFLTFGFVSTPDTAFEGVQQVKPAHYLVVEQGRVSEHEYWRPALRAESASPLAVAQQEYLDLLRGCVQDRLVADVPVGLLLSGGIDSCSIAVILGELRAKIPTFTIRFSERDLDEGEIARRVAEQVGAEHTELVVKMDDVVPLLPKLVWHYEQPFADSSAIPTYYVSQMARQRVTVVLNGDGGDESFAGYRAHGMLHRLNTFQMVPKPIWQLVEGASGLARHVIGDRPRLNWLQRGSRMAQRGGWESAWRWLAAVGEQLRPLLAGDWLAALGDTPPGLVRLEAYWQQAAALEYINRVAYACNSRFHLVDDLLVKMDRATMANSLEARAPFLDYRMIEFGLSIPAKWKIRAGQTKWFARYAMRDYLPDEVLWKRKTGFGIPIRQWMKGHLGEVAWRIILSDRSLARGYLNGEALLSLREDYQQNKVDCSTALYYLLILELWHRSYIDTFAGQPDESILID